MRSIYLLVGAVLVIVGILGFVLPHPLLGLFEVNTLHNIVHVATGALTLIAATQGIGPMRMWGKALGFFYLAVLIVGHLSPHLFGLMPLNGPDHMLHAGLVLVYLYVGLLAPPRL